MGIHGLVWEYLSIHGEYGNTRIVIGCYWYLWAIVGYYGLLLVITGCYGLLREERMSNHLLLSPASINGWYGNTRVIYWLNDWFNADQMMLNVNKKKELVSIIDIS